MRRHPGAVTITDVADLAGVSPATVSRVVNGRFSGDPAVADRVRAAAAELRYSPNPLARSLALGKTRTIAFVVPDLANPIFHAMLSSLSKTAAKDGYRVLVADSAESPADEPELAREVRRRCDAVVLCAPRMPDAQLDALLEPLRPLVLINRVDRAGRTPSLCIDYRSGVHDLARHLWGLGHRHVAFVEGPAGSTSNLRRLEGLADAEWELPGLRVDRVAGGATIDDGLAAAGRVRETAATAAIGFNDLVAIGLMRGLDELGVSVPQDVSVTGFDDIPFARFSHPALTTMSIGHEELGAQAWRCVRALVATEETGPDLQFRPRLEVRESTASPRG